jgi:hypothetical protein
VRNAVDSLSATYTASPLLFWVLGSALIYVVGSYLRWFFRSIPVVRSLPGRGLVEAGRFLFFLGIPYLALGGWPRQPYQGLLSLEDLGLVGLSVRWPVTRWLEAAGTGLAVGLAALLILSVAWLRARHGPEDTRLHFPHRPGWWVVINVLYLEAHWAFYRAGLGSLLDDVYAGVFLGLGLIYLEWGLNPFWRRGWRRPARAAERWLRAALALVIALVFLLTRNLWVCVGIHGLLELPFWYLGRERAPSAAL